MTDIFIGEPVDTGCTSNIDCDLDNYVYAICRCELPKQQFYDNDAKLSPINIIAMECDLVEDLGGIDGQS